MNIAEFIAKWKKADLKERSAAQEHFIDLCRLMGHPTPVEADPTGDHFCFERGAEKHGGGDGFADVWKKDFFGWEYKGRHKDLSVAYDQLLLYRDALANPPLLVVCDMDRIVVHTNFTKTVSATHEIPLDRLGEPRSMEILQAVFSDPEKLRPGKTSEAITQDAAEQVAGIAESMRQRGLDSAQVAHFLDRVVFCLFAEDIGLLPNQIFTRITEKASGDPAKFSRFVGQLFEAMSIGGEFGLENIRHFNGSLFNDSAVLELTADEVVKITAAALLNWSAVDPSIFGTLFERGLDPAKRTQLGAHFTGREDIETLVNAVVMQPLRREWDETRQIIGNLLETGKKGVRPPRGWHSRGYLPHFDHPGLVQSVTFRLADSLPSEKLDQWRKELGHESGARASRPQSDETDARAIEDKLGARAPCPQSGDESGARASCPQMLQEKMEFHHKIEEWLNSGHGACHLRNSRIAEVVENALLHFDGERYRLVAWTIMPNHVHVAIETVDGFRLQDVVHSWKSFTAKEANRILGEEGKFWQEDYFDRYIRDEKHLKEVVSYIEQNPVAANLVARAKDWRFGSAGRSAGVPPAFHEKDAGKMPAPQKNISLKPGLQKKAIGEAGRIVHHFLTRLQTVKVLDPACGSGNFLYVTLQKLKDLEKEVILYSMEKGLGSFLPLVGPWQLYGLEINSYAYDLAQMTVWIGWLQWIKFNGFGSPQEPILRAMQGNFQCRDAIIDFGEDAGGTPAPPKEPDWPRVDFIVGNPPFLGGNKIRKELGSDYVDALFELYKGRVPAFADLCCYWFEKARAHIEQGGCKRAGLLATQGIRGGANREVLKRIKETGDIFWAVSDKDWILDGANVHVSIVGFDAGSEETRTLDSAPVATINPDLTSAANISQAKILKENQGMSFQGPSPKASFDIDAATACTMLAATGNPNKKPNSDVVRPVASAIDLVRGSRTYWTIDFALMSLEEAAQYEAPFEYVKRVVYPVRAQNRRASYAEKWWQYAEARPGMRAALNGLSRFIATPRVSKHRIFVWLNQDVLANDGTIVFARSDDYFFGILHSRLHEVWAISQGTQLREKESGFRYTPTTSFETLPFPFGGAGILPASSRPDETSAPRQAITDAARELVAKREEWLTGADKKPRHLTRLYNERPTWLDLAHKKLDAAVFAAYGWNPSMTDPEILEALLALNLERAGA